MRLRALLVAAAAALAQPVFAAGYGEFTGDWQNDNPSTQDLARLRVSSGPSGLRVRAWGQCHPNDCDWGRVNSVEYSFTPSVEPSAGATDVVATFNAGPTQKVLVLTDRPNNRLSYTIFTRYTDGSKRASFVTRGTLRRRAGGWADGPGGPRFDDDDDAGPNVAMNPSSPAPGGAAGAAPSSPLGAVPGASVGAAPAGPSSPSAPASPVGPSVPSGPGGLSTSVPSSPSAPSGPPPSALPPVASAPSVPSHAVAAPEEEEEAPAASDEPEVPTDALSFREDCFTINLGQVEARTIAGEWKVTQGNRWLLTFGDNEGEARRAADIIRHYRFTHQCFIGRPNIGMAYWKRDGGVPTRGYADDDCVRNNPETTRARFISGQWKIVDPGHQMLAFGARQSDARKAEEVIKHYRLNRQCFVGRPHPSMSYWLSE